MEKESESSTTVNDGDDTPIQINRYPAGIRQRAPFSRPPMSRPFGGPPGMRPSASGFRGPPPSRGMPPPPYLTNRGGLPNRGIRGASSNMPSSRGGSRPLSGFGGGAPPNGGSRGSGYPRGGMRGGGGPRFPSSQYMDDCDADLEGFGGMDGDMAEDYCGGGYSGKQGNNFNDEMYEDDDLLDTDDLFGQDEDMRQKDYFSKPTAFGMRGNAGARPPFRGGPMRGGMGGPGSGRFERPPNFMGSPKGVGGPATNFRAQNNYGQDSAGGYHGDQQYGGPYGGSRQPGGEYGAYQQGGPNAFPGHDGGPRMPLAGAHEEIWVENKAPDGSLYYYHMHTRQSRWDKPAGPNIRVIPHEAPVVQPQQPTANVQPNPMVMPTPAAFMPGIVPAAVLPRPAAPPEVAEWSEYRTPEGRPYYHNMRTSETTWERPKVMCDWEAFVMSTQQAMPQWPGHPAAMFGAPVAAAAAAAAAVVQTQPAATASAVQPAYVNNTAMMMQQQPVNPATVVNNNYSNNSTAVQPPVMNNVQPQQISQGQAYADSPQQQAASNNQVQQPQPVVSKAAAEQVHIQHQHTSSSKPAVHNIVINTMSTTAHNVTTQQTVSTAAVSTITTTASDSTNKNATAASTTTTSSTTSGTTSTTATAEDSRPVFSVPIAGSPWCLVWTGDGRVFFFNPSARTSVWEMPDEFKGRADVDALIKNPPHKQPPVTSQASTTEQQQVTTNSEQQAGKGRKMEDDGSQSPPNKKARDEKSPMRDADKPLLERDKIELGKEAAMEAEAEAARERANLSLDVRMAQFREMLSEKKIGGGSVWEKELQKIVFDPRYLLLTSKERKSVFDKFVKEKAEEERTEKKNKVREQKERFRQFLRDCGFITVKTSFMELAENYSKDERFLSVESSREREAIFFDYVAELRRTEQEERLQEKERIRLDFLALLKEQPGLNRKSHWREVKKVIDSDHRYKAVDSSSKKEDWFRDYIRKLEDKPVVESQKEELASKISTTADTDSNKDTSTGHHDSERKSSSRHRHSSQSKTSSTDKPAHKSVSSNGISSLEEMEKIFVGLLYKIYGNVENSEEFNTPDAERQKRQGRLLQKPILHDVKKELRKEPAYEQLHALSSSVKDKLLCSYVINLRLKLKLISPEEAVEQKQQQSSGN